MKALFIGGTGTISTACARLALEQGWELTCMNRGNRRDVLPDKVEWLQVDCNDAEAMKKAVEGRYFDVVAEFIGFTPFAGGA